MANNSVSKIINKLLISNEFMNEIYTKSKNTQHFNDLLGIVFKYYIATRDTRLLSFGEIERAYHRIGEEGTIKNLKKNETPKQALQRNIITEGFVTHSANGYNKKSIKKYGLGDKRIYDSQLGKDLAFLEEKIEKSKYVENQTNYSSEIYYTSPGANSFHYATSFSPERLFLGPLRQDRDTALPVIIGETKEEYMMRVAQKKVKQKIADEKEQIAVLKVYKRVIHKLCSKSPVIELIPIQNNKFELNASNAWAISQNPLSLNDWIQKMAEKDMGFFADIQGGSDPSNMGNLVSVGVKVPSSALTTIDVPDGFEVLQNIAITRGLKKGDQIDFFTGEQVLVKEDESKAGPVSSVEPLPIVHDVIEFEFSQKSNFNSKKPKGQR